MEPVLINQSFNCFEEFALATQAWDVDFLQIENGVFEAHLIQYIFQDVLFSRAYFNRGFDQKGTAPKGMWTFAISASPNVRLKFKGHSINGCGLMVYPPGSEISAVSFLNFDVLTFSASESYLELISEKNQFPDFRNHLKGIDVFILKKKDMDLIRQQLKYLSSELLSSEYRPEYLNQKNWLMDTISAFILAAVFQKEKSVYITKFKKRDKAFQKAMEYIHSFANEELNVRKLIKLTGVSERTLQYIFKERLNLSPKKYISLYRLNRVHKELLTTPGSGKTITRLAGKWGFWHMGQFAKDYQKLFGELPSTHLKRYNLDFL